MYRKIAIGLGAATLATAGIYGHGVEVAEKVHASHTPLYGALGFLTLAFLLCALASWALGVILDRPAIATTTARATENPTEAAAVLPIEEFDSAPTVAMGWHPVDPRVPAQRIRARVYHCPPEDARAPMTIEMEPAKRGEMIPADVVADQFARLYQYLRPDEERRWADGLNAAATIALPPDVAGPVN